MQSVPMFYSLNAMTVNDWFSMLDKALPGESIPEEEENPTYIYEVNAEEPFDFNNDSQEPGKYFMRASVDSVAELSVMCDVHKLSFSRLVFLSDVFTTLIPSVIPDNQAIKELAFQGEASRYFEKEIASITTRGLEKMREKTWKKYFDQGLMAIVYRFFSALVNFFNKYNRFVDTGIYLPGNTCNYSAKVENQIKSIKESLKETFVRHAYEASKEILSERLEIPLDELEEMSNSQIKNIYHKKALQFHPDKNPGDQEAEEEFKRINTVWGDFDQLTKLKAELAVERDDEEFFLEKKENFSANNPLANRPLRVLLTLPAPIAAH